MTSFVCKGCGLCVFTNALPDHRRCNSCIAKASPPPSKEWACGNCQMHNYGSALCWKCHSPQPHGAKASPPVGGPVPAPKETDHAGQVATAVSLLMKCVPHLDLAVSEHNDGHRLRRDICFFLAGLGYPGWEKDRR